MRWLWLIGSLTAALILAVVTARTPPPAASTAPAAAFSAQRAMADVREIAQRPHPVGSADHACVRAVLLERMRALGLQVSTQSAPLNEGAKRFAQLNPGVAPPPLINLIGVLPGRDPSLPAVALIAHYDTTPHSPGAADDSAGVAAILESVRAIKARGPTQRTVVVLFTDAEELYLDGARAFFARHPLADRIGAVVNLEARGGGGRAWMFETGRGNAQTVDLYASTARRVTGGRASSSLSVFVYEQMPNGTDFTLAKDKGIQGVNIAFVGRAGHYHTPASTPDALDVGGLQHLGSQALEIADALLRAPALPAATTDVVYSDILGLTVLAYPPIVGWGVLGLAVALLAFAVWRARRAAGLTFADMGRGVLDGVWFLAAGLVVARAIRVLAGPLVTSSEIYYAMMARLSWLTVAVGLALLAVGLIALAGRARLSRLWITGAVLLAAIISVALGGFDPVTLAAAILALGLSAFPATAPRSTWAGWTGLILLVLVFGLAAQALAPPTAYILVWPAVLAAGAAAIAAAVQPGLTRPFSLAPAALTTVLGGAWLFGLAHLLILSLGTDFPGLAVLPGVMILMLARPLSPETKSARRLHFAAVITLLVAAGVALGARLVTTTMPPS